MSSALSDRSDAASMSWFGKKSSKSDGRLDKAATREGSKSSSSRSLGSLASALGLRTKKQHPTLAIQEPPPLVGRSNSSRSPVSEYPPSASRPKTAPYAARPPSKSVSSTRSPVDSFELKTPVDDPYPSRSITVAHSSPPSDPSRLSAYSSASATVPDYASKNGSDRYVSRGSVASSSTSSYSQYNSGESLSPAMSPTTQDSSSRHYSLSSKKSMGSLPGRGHNSAKEPLATAWDAVSRPSSTPFATSSLTLTDKNRLSQPEPVRDSRAATRTRGNADKSSHPASFFFDNESSQSGSSSLASSLPPPRPVVRKPSSSRIRQPPSAPPSHELPPPPKISTVNLDNLDHDADSGSSSSLSFVTRRDGLLKESPYTPVRGQARTDTSLTSRSTDLEPDSSPTDILPHVFPPTLKKAVSQQSLTKRSLSAGSPRVNPGNASTPASPQTTTPPVPEKGPRKQRSFHHPRFPLPNLPTGPRTPTSTTFPSSSDLSGASESKRSSLGGPPRKRLFSGSSTRRPSTSQSPNDRDDDLRSVASLPVDTERMISFSAFSSSTSVSNAGNSSEWHSCNSHTPPTSPPQPQPEYVPQRIVSAEEVAQIEAESLAARQKEKGLRARALSGGSERSPDGALSPGGPARSTSMQVPHKPMGKNSRPSTSQGDDPEMISLSPPPKTWTRTAHEPLPAASDDPPMIPLQPPPRKNRKKATASEPPPAAANKFKAGKSIMRKPSFLDIGNDDSDKEDVSKADPKASAGDSFLDLARESFDTQRESLEGK